MNRAPFALVAAAVLPLSWVTVTGGCDIGLGEEPGRTPATFTHEAYVWQRAWTPSVVDAVRTRGPAFDGLRVWGAEIETDGRVSYAAPPSAALQTLGPIIVVVRIDGSVPLDGDQVEPVVKEALAAFEGADVRGIEIDHDCATARLSAYAQTLSSLRSAYAGAGGAGGAGGADGDGVAGLTLSITALPAWSAARALDDVLAEVDHVVLQVHAVDAPQAGSAASLFTSQRARTFIDAFAPRAARAGVPWRVALPAYGSRLSFDDDGRVIAVASEGPGAGPGVGPTSRARPDVEVRVDPADVATLLRSLEVKRPRGLAGVVWFRLPVDGDRRAWSFTTLEAVRAGRDLAPRLRVLVRPDSDNSSGLHDVVIANTGVVDAHAPHRVELDVVALVAADGVNGFSFDQGFSSLHPPRIAPGSELVVGWVRAQEVMAHEAR